MHRPQSQSITAANLQWRVNISLLFQINSWSEPMKCHPSCERSCDVHIQLHPKNPSGWSGGDFFFCAPSTLLESLDLVATSWDEWMSGGPTIYTTAPFSSAQEHSARHCPPSPPLPPLVPSPLCFDRKFHQSWVSALIRPRHTMRFLSTTC